MTDVSEEDAEEILLLVKNQIEEISKASRHPLPPNKVAILTSLNMAEHYVKLKREFFEYRRRVDTWFDLLAQRIERTNK